MPQTHCCGRNPNWTTKKCDCKCPAWVSRANKNWTCILSLPWCNDRQIIVFTLFSACKTHAQHINDWNASATTQHWKTKIIATMILCSKWDQQMYKENTTRQKSCDEQMLTTLACQAACCNIETRPTTKKKQKPTTPPWQQQFTFTSLTADTTP